MNCYLLRYSEIGLKSNQTRKRWLQVLRKNIEKALFWNDVEHGRIDIVQGRLILYGHDRAAIDALSHVFGLVSFSPALEIDADIEEIKRAAIDLYKERDPRSFRVTTQRVTKDFEMTSIELNYCVGEAVYECGGKVDLRNHELNIGIEIINDKAYVFDKTHRGPGGLPVGVQGDGCAIVRDFRDFVSALLFMKRGCPIDLIVIRSSMASNYIDLLQEFYHDGLRILMIDKEWETNAAIERYAKEGAGVFVTGRPTKMPAGMTNLCPCELYTNDMLLSVIDDCNISDIPSPTINFKISAGCVIYYNDTILLLRRKKEKTWVLPKGGVDDREFFREAALREACEESGQCSMDLLAYVGKSHYSASDMHGPFTKDVYYYLCESRKNSIALEYLFDSFTFLPKFEARELLSFDNDKTIVDLAEKIRQHIAK